MDKTVPIGAHCMLLELGVELFEGRSQQIISLGILQQTPLRLAYRGTHCSHDDDVARRTTRVR